MAAAAVTGQTIESGHTDAIHDAQLDYYGRRLATASSDRTIRLFNVTQDQHSHIADLIGGWPSHAKLQVAASDVLKVWYQVAVLLP